MPPGGSLDGRPAPSTHSPLDHAPLSQYRVSYRRARPRRAGSPSGPTPTATSGSRSPPPRPRGGRPRDGRHGGAGALLRPARLRRPHRPPPQPQRRRLQLRDEAALRPPRRAHGPPPLCAGLARLRPLGPPARRLPPQPLPAAAPPLPQRARGRAGGRRGPLAGLRVRRRRGRGVPPARAPARARHADGGGRRGRGLPVPTRRRRRPGRARPLQPRLPPADREEDPAVVLRPAGLPRKSSRPRCARRLRPRDDAGRGRPERPALLRPGRPVYAGRGPTGLPAPGGSDAPPRAARVRIEGAELRAPPRDRRRRRRAAPGAALEHGAAAAVGER